jgi:poly-gamma-glutamate capsule biosynthesis protein CapA/YwtB (metallophosphatase superfamily)
VTDSDRESARGARLERQRAAARQRRNRAMAIGGAAVAVVLLAVGIGGAALASARSRSLPAIAVERYAASAETSATLAAMDRAASAAAAASNDETISIVAVGDLLFDLGPRRLIDAQGGKAPLAKVAAVMRAADLTIANLETPLSNRGAAVTGKPANLIFNGDPRGVASLTDAGVDVVSLANNHAMDHGAIALRDTIATLDKAGVKHVGAGMNTAEAWKPAILEVKGRRIAYITATQIVPAHFDPGPSRAGIANGKDVAKVVSAIRTAKKTADIVIVSLHWGTEQSTAANSAQQSQARRFIDAGADMVLSHHPHVMQGIDMYKGKLIAYSLGNFLFPYKTTEGRKSFILRFDYGPHGAANITAVPVYLGEWGRPTVQTGASARSILGKLDSISRPFGTKVVVRGDIGRVVP